jgi:hypothetical protein
MNTYDALRSSAGTDLRAWLDDNADTIRKWEHFARALQGQEVLDSGGKPISGLSPEEHWWRPVLERNGVPVDAALAVVEQKAQEILRRPAATPMPDNVRVAAAMRVLAIIASRDRKAAKDWLHASNKTSLAFFRDVTGYAKPDQWFASVGYDLEEERRAAEAARAARVEQERLAEKAARAAKRSAKEEEKLNEKVRYRDGNNVERIASVRDFLTERVRDGYRRIEPERDGMTVKWWLWNDAKGEGSGIPAGVVGRDYAAEEIERVTGVAPIIPTLPTIVNYSQSVTGWTMRKAPRDFVKDSMTPRSGVYSKGMYDTKKEAVAMLDRWSREYTDSGAKVIELAVVTYSDRDGKKYAPVIVTEPREEAVAEYRYGVRNRPPGYGTVPKGYIRIEPARPGEPRTRHGIVVYDRPLTDEEARGYELHPYMPLAEVVDRVIASFGEYAEDLASDVREAGDRMIRETAGAEIDRISPGVYTDIPLGDVYERVAQELLRRFPA